MESQTINRNLFEIFLQKRDLVGVRGAAVQLGMRESSFKNVLSALVSAGYVFENEASDDGVGIFQSSLLKSLYKRLPSLARMTFSTHSSFVDRLHNELRAIADVKIEPLYDKTSEVIGENSKMYAHDFDIISDEPMGLPFQLWIETGKPIQLRPDSCSWLTYLRFENTLKGQLMGALDPEIERYRDAVQGCSY